MQENLTPEEKLLHLIKEGAPSQKPKNEEAPISEPISLSSQPQRLVSPPKSSLVNLIKTLTKIGIYLNLFLLMILGYQFIFGAPILPLPHHNDKDISSLPLPSMETNSDEKFDQYIEIFSKKNIFKSFGEAPPLMQSGEISRTIEDYLKNLFLSGIISGISPQAIVEDRSNGQFYYVSKGDFIGSLQVIEVGDNYILLKYGEDEGRLTL